MYFLVDDCETFVDDNLEETTIYSSPVGVGDNEMMVADLAEFFKDKIYFEAELITPDVVEAIRNQIQENNGKYLPYHCVDCIEPSEDEDLETIANIVREIK